MDKQAVEQQLCQLPVSQYAWIDPRKIEFSDRVRYVCKHECPMYGTSWACPPAVGTLEECERKIKSYPQAIFFSSVAEVSDVMNMAEMLATRDAHEELTTEVAGFLKGEGFETFTLSTESCDLCEHCAYLDGKPCRFPEKMHPCLESHGVVVNELVEHHSMEYNLGGNTILWFSLVLFRQRA